MTEHTDAVAEQAAVDTIGGGEQGAHGAPEANVEASGKMDSAEDQMMSDSSPGESPADEEPETDTQMQAAEEPLPAAGPDPDARQADGEFASSEPTAQVEGSADEEASDSVTASNDAVTADEPATQLADESEAETADALAVAGIAPEDAATVEVQLSDDGTTRVVRMLSVGEQVSGVVKRITDFGAFVDIGVGRDGLIHISELSIRRVGKVTDMLQEGQEIKPWIKKLDRDRNRISLTLIDPETRTIRDLEKGDIVQGTVTRILPYGAFVDIGIGRDALLHVREMGEGYIAKPEDVVKAGDSIEARIIDLSRRRSRVDLTLKGLRPEPEPEPVQVQQPAQPEAEPEEEGEDTFAELEVLSPMELAFKRAMEAEGIELNVQKNKRHGKRNRRENARTIQDEIIRGR